MELSAAVQRQLDNAKKFTAVEEEEEVTPEKEEVNPLQEEVARLEHRLKTVQGMWDAEKKKWGSEKNDLIARLNELEKIQKEQKRNTPVSVTNALTQEEIDELDPSEVARLNRIAQAAAMAAVKQAREDFEEEMAPVRQQIQSTQNLAIKGKEELFWTELSMLVPDWSAINDNPKFHAWLAEEDDLSGNTRQDILITHQQNLNAKKVAGMFQAFKKSLPNKSTSQIVPDPASVPMEAPKAELVKASEYHRFMHDAARGKYDKTSAHYKKLYEKFDKAAREGRLIS